MKIKWLGHSCFLITSDEGKKVLTDPFDNQVGYKVPSVEADIVTTSHKHFDHNYIAAVKGNYIHISEPGKYQPEGMEITGISVFHDEEGGAKRGKNIIYTYVIDGIKVCHCGDLGHVLTQKQVKEIGKVDVLLVPIGGVYTINYSGAVEILKLLNPQLTIPMHFKTEVLKFSLESIEKFLECTGGIRAGSQEIEINKENLSQNQGVVVLNYQ